LHYQEQKMKIDFNFNRLTPGVTTLGIAVLVLTVIILVLKPGTVKS